MVNRPKRLGTSWETEVVRYLREHGYCLAERRALAGTADTGDIAGTPFTWECKNTQTIDLAGGMDELTKEIANDDRSEYGFLIVKRRRKSVSDAYAVMSLEQLCRLLGRSDDD